MKKSKKFLTGCMTILLSGALGCAGSAECNIKEEHAHKYQNGNGYVTYYNSEKLSKNGFNRDSDYILINENEKQELDFLSKNNLIKICDNVEQIENLKEEYSNYDHIEYYYSYTSFIPVYNGKFVTIIPIVHSGWTLDKDKMGVTTETRTCHYTFRSYSYNYGNLNSKTSDDIIETMNEYPFVNPCMVIAVDENGNELYDAVTDLEYLKELKEKYPEEFISNKKLILK